MLIKWNLGQKSIIRDKILNSIVLHLYVPKNMASKYTKEKLAKLAKNRHIHNHSGKS